MAVSLLASDRIDKSRQPQLTLSDHPPSSPAGLYKAAVLADLDHIEATATVGRSDNLAGYLRAAASDGRTYAEMPNAERTQSGELTTPSVPLYATETWQAPCKGIERDVESLETSANAMLAGHVSRDVRLTGCCCCCCCCCCCKASCRKQHHPQYVAELFSLNAAWDASSAGELHRHRPETSHFTWAWASSSKWRGENSVRYYSASELLGDSAANIQAAISRVATSLANEALCSGGSVLQRPDPRGKPRIRGPACSAFACVSEPSTGHHVGKPSAAAPSLSSLLCMACRSWFHGNIRVQSTAAPGLAMEYNTSEQLENQMPAVPSG